MVKNIFGIFAGKQDKTYTEEEVKKDESTEQAEHNISEEDVFFAKDTLQTIVDTMGFMSVIKVRNTETELILEIKSDEVGRIIGKDGATLDALQYLIRNILRRRVTGKYNLVVDANDYRSRKIESLQQKAIKLAQVALDENRKVKIGNLSPYDRRIVHMALENNNSVETFSEGERGSRQLIIAPIINE